VSKPAQLLVQITGQPPLEAVPALHSNFVGICRVGGEVQFEFIFVDLNQLANMIQQNEARDNNPLMAAAEKTGPLTPLSGKTVAKLVMPAEYFLQLQPHLEKMFSDIKIELEKNERKEPNAKASVNS
jgi:hypothetical protein